MMNASPEFRLPAEGPTLGATAFAPNVRPRPPISSVLAIPLLGLLAVEFLLGMALNLFIAVPSGSPATILATSPWLDVHIAVGVMLLGLLGRVLSLGVRARDRSTAVAGAIGLGSGLGAFLAGLSFAFGGGSAGASYLMSVGFAGLLLSAALLLRASWTRRPEPSSPGAA
ncbi:MAG: hypothetical protein L3K23_03165 [Thermoplasmata archaeon]|nr:hypothetical protein [Thermoplasmata archaeon]